MKKIVTYAAIALFLGFLGFFWYTLLDIGMRVSDVPFRDLPVICLSAAGIVLLVCGIYWLMQLVARRCSLEALNLAVTSVETLLLARILRKMIAGLSERVSPENADFTEND